MRFSPEDRDILQRLIFDPTAQPSFELMKACLVWPDERPNQISKEGYELLGDLWIVRGYIHKGLPANQWGLDPAYFQIVWNQALSDVPEWPGFQRLVLSDTDGAYLANCVAETSINGDY